MNRRDFIKTMPVLATVPYMPSIVGSNSRHLITIGTSGANILENNYSKLDFDSFTIINDCYPRSIGVKAEYFKFSPPDEAYNFLAERKFLKKEPFPVIDINEDIKQAISSKSGEVVIKSALGKYSVTVLWLSIAKAFVGYTNIHFIGAMPFAFEGSYIRYQAIKVASEIGSIYQSRFVDLEDVRKKYGNISIRSAFAIGDEELMRRLICW